MKIHLPNNTKCSNFVWKFDNSDRFSLRLNVFFTLQVQCLNSKGILNFILVQNHMAK